MTMGHIPLEDALAEFKDDLARFKIFCFDPIEGEAA